MPFPISLEEIQKTEEKLGLSFPRSFKVKMSGDNGGTIDLDEGWFLFPFRNSENNKLLARTANDIASELAMSKDYLPEGLVPIAEDGEGNYLVLKADAENKSLSNQVYKWLHESPEEIELVFNDFSEAQIS